MEIDVRLEGFDEAERALARLIATLADLRPFWPSIVPLFVGWMREQFATEGEFLLGEHWAPLSPDYAARKAVLYPGKGILYATGDLRRAASLPRRIATPQTLTLEIDDSNLRHGATAPRAVGPYHQEGTDRMPARPLIGEEFPPTAVSEVVEAADRYVDEMVARLGLA